MEKNKVAFLTACQIYTTKFPRCFSKLAIKIYAKLCISVKTVFWYSTNLAKTANKMYFPFNFAKISKSRHFTVRGLKDLKPSPDTAIDSSFQKDVLENLLLFSFICY